MKAQLDLIKINSSIKGVILLSSSGEIQSEINKVSEYEVRYAEKLRYYR